MHLKWQPIQSKLMIPELAVLWPDTAPYEKPTEG